MIYLDANFLVFANFDPKVKGDSARAILQEIVRGKTACTSALALDEVMWAIMRNHGRTALREVIEDVYATKNLAVVPVPATTPLGALELMELHKLKPRDAFHVAIMRQLGIKEIVSDDSDFDRIPGIKRRKLQ